MPADDADATLAHGHPLPSLSLLRERLARAAGAPGTEVQEARAAVAAVLRERDPVSGPELLYIRRADNPRDPWSGHVAFPGGRHEPRDGDLLSTALRETREEIGLDLHVHASLLSRLPDVPAIARGRRTGLIITPFVFALETHEGEVFDLNHEVASTLWVPLRTLRRGEGSGTFPYVYEGTTYELPCVTLDADHRLWGLTLQMTRLLLDAAAP